MLSPRLLLAELPLNEHPDFRGGRGRLASRARVRGKSDVTSVWPGKGGTMGQRESFPLKPSPMPGSSPAALSSVGPA